MAPREPPKPVTKVQRAVKDMQNNKGRSSPVGAVKKPAVIKKTREKTPLKVTTTNTETPKPKEKKGIPVPNSTSKSAKKPTWKRRPKPAHSGVPIPEKMRKMMEKQFLDPEFALCSF